jgi:tetraacyldisaccharide 4'-kinase
VAAAGLEALLQRHWWRRRPSALALALLPLAALYAALAALHRLPYRLGLRRAQALPVPVVVVGNLVVGGAGKTPAVIALLQWLRARGHRPGVVARGYGRRGDDVRAVDAHSTAAEVGDEPLLIARRGAAPVVVGRDRVAAARALLRADPRVDVIVADDGLQHLRLARTLAIVVFDERGIGNALPLPAGPLRAPMPAQVPPRTLVLYSAGRATTHWRGGSGRRRLAGLVELAAWQRGERSGATAPAALAARCRAEGLRPVAAAGIAVPQRFFDMLAAQGLAFDPIALPDHHAWARLPWPAGTPLAIVTEKDAVKLDPARVGATAVWVATLDFVFEPDFEAALAAAWPAVLATPTETPRR